MLVGEANIPKCVKQRTKEKVVQVVIRRFYTDSVDIWPPTILDMCQKWWQDQLKTRHKILATVWPLLWRWAFSLSGLFYICLANSAGNSVCWQIWRTTGNICCQPVKAYIQCFLSNRLLYHVQYGRQILGNVCMALYKKWMWIWHLGFLEREVYM